MILGDVVLVVVDAPRKSTVLLVLSEAKMTRKRTGKMKA